MPKPPAVEQTRPMNIILADRQIARLREEAHRDGSSISELIRRAIDAYAPAENGKEEGR